MQISPKARLISIIVAVVFMFGALTGTGAYLIINHLNNVKATTQTDTSIDNIFNPNGTINATAAVDLLEAVGFFDNRNDTGTYKAHQIRTRNNSSTYNGDATIIFPMGYYNGTDIYWQATYLYNNYLTIWMVKNYTNSTWNESSVTVNYTAYANSTIQNYLDNTLWSALTMGSGTLQSIFALPSNVGYQSTSTANTTYWDRTSSRTTTTYNNLASAVANSSYLWLPSAGETMNNQNASWTNNTTSYTGQWGLNSTDRSFNTSNYDGTSTRVCWLRSGHSSNISLAVRVTSSGYDGIGSLNNIDGVRPAAHISLNALNSAATKTITVSSNNTSYGTVSGSGSYAINSTINIYAYPKTGYQLKGWSTNGGSTIILGSEGKTTYPITVTSNTNYTAVFEPVMYTVTTDVNITEAGTVSGRGSYQQGTQATLTANLTNSNYKFVGWDTTGDNVVDISATTNPYVFTVTGNALITAIFEKLPTITITTNSENYGKILYNNSLITSTQVIQGSGTQISNLYAISSAGYAFLYWLDSATGQRYTDNPLDFTVSTDTTLTAVFGSSMADGVAVCVESLEGATAAIGEARITGYSNIDGVDYVHFSAVAYTGYQFLGWYIMGEETPISTELSTDLALSQVQNKIIIARFTPIENQNDMNAETDNTQTGDFVFF